MAKTTKTKRKIGRSRPQTARKRTKRASSNRTAARKAAAQPLPPLPENESEDQLGAYGGDRGETDEIQP